MAVIEDMTAILAIIWKSITSIESRIAETNGLLTQSVRVYYTQQQLYMTKSSQYLCLPALLDGRTHTGPDTRQCTCSRRIRLASSNTEHEIHKEYPPHHQSTPKPSLQHERAHLEAQLVSAWIHDHSASPMGCNSNKYFWWCSTDQDCRDSCTWGGDCCSWGTWRGGRTKRWSCTVVEAVRGCFISDLLGYWMRGAMHICSIWMIWNLKSATTIITSSLIPQRKSKTINNCTLSINYKPRISSEGGNVALNVEFRKLKNSLKYLMISRTHAWRINRCTFIPSITVVVNWRAKVSSTTCSRHKRWTCVQNGSLL